MFRDYTVIDVSGKLISMAANPQGIVIMAFGKPVMRIDESGDDDSSYLFVDVCQESGGLQQLALGSESASQYELIVNARDLKDEFVPFRSVPANA